MTRKSVRWKCPTCQNDVEGMAILPGPAAELYRASGHVANGFGPRFGRSKSVDSGPNRLSWTWSALQNGGVACIGDVPVRACFLLFY
jgi:hypothetical protein